MVAVCYRLFVGVGAVSGCGYFEGGMSCVFDLVLVYSYDSSDLTKRVVYNSEIMPIIYIILCLFVAGLFLTLSVIFEKWYFIF